VQSLPDMRNILATFKNKNKQIYRYVSKAWIKLYLKSFIPARYFPRGFKACGLSLAAAY